MILSRDKFSTTEKILFDSPRFGTPCAVAVKPEPLVDFPTPLVPEFAPDFEFFGRSPLKVLTLPLLLFLFLFLFTSLFPPIPFGRRAESEFQ